MRYDVLVVGAGPAGSHAARLLAQGGARVALLDKARFPRYKPCGGGLTARARQLLDWDLTDQVEDEIRRIVFIHRFLDPVAMENETPLIHMVMRDRLDAALLERAAAAGAELAEGVELESVQMEPAGVTLRAGDHIWQGAYLVGADGARSAVARRLSFPPRRMGIALEGEVMVPDGHLENCRGSIILNHGSLPAGYDWLFPKAGHLSLGTGTFRSHTDGLKTHYLECEKKFALPVTGRRSLRGHPIPLTAEGPGCWHKERALLVGDAAGLVDPFTGEGLYGAFLSARAAAGSLLQVLAGEEHNLEPYTADLQKHLLPELQAAERLARVVYGQPGLIHRLVKRDREILARLSLVLLGRLSYQELLAWLVRRYALLKIWLAYNTRHRWP